MPETDEKAVYVVFAAAAQQSTGARLAQQVVAIQADRESAERVAAEYREKVQDADHVSMRVFTQRYVLPYAAPAVRDLVDNG